MTGIFVLLDAKSWEPQGKKSSVYNWALDGQMFSRDGRYLAYGDREAVRMVDLRDSETAIEFPNAGHTEYILSAAFSPDGKTLASASEDGSIVLWDVETRQQVGQLELEYKSSSVPMLGFSLDGNTLVSLGLGMDTLLWDMRYDAWRESACYTANRNLTQDEWNQFVGPSIPYECTCRDMPPGEGVPLDACEGTE